MEINAKRDLYCFVEALRVSFNLNSDAVDTVNICQHDDTTELLFHEFKTRGICGTALIGEKNDTIVLNSKRNKTEQNFDCGHEIIHCTKHKDCPVQYFNCFEKVLPQQNSFLEWEANEGSAELLVPYKKLLPQILESQIYSKSAFSIDRFKVNLSRGFNVPPAVIHYRLESLKYEIEQYVTGTPIDEVIILSDTCQKQQGIFIKSLNDIQNDLSQKTYLH